MGPYRGGVEKAALNLTDYELPVLQTVCRRHVSRSAAEPAKQRERERGDANEPEFKNRLIRNVYSPDCGNCVVKEDI
jgi:hypothetical protein